MIVDEDNDDFPGRVLEQECRWDHLESQSDNNEKHSIKTKGFEYKSSLLPPPSLSISNMSASNDNDVINMARPRSRLYRRRLPQPHPAQHRSSMAPAAMSDPCDCCKSKVKFIRQMRGNFKDSVVIPQRLMNHFGGDTSGTIKLESPNGQVYDVGVAKKVNRTVLLSGWEAFVDANQIQENNSLMFRYIGFSCFKVTVFDSNGEERILCRARMGNPSQVEKPSMHRSVVLASPLDGTTQSSDSDDCYITPGKIPAVKYSADEFSGEQMEEIEAFVSKIQSEIPVLVVKMNKTNVSDYPDLVIHKEYAGAYFPPRTRFVTLKVPENSKGWQCKFCIRPVGGHNLYLRDFVPDNHVQEGDLCLFQPITEVEATNFAIMVHLLSKAGRAGIPSNQGGDNPHECGSICLDQRETSSKLHYVLSSRCRLDEEDVAEVDALGTKIQPDIPFLVVQMTKSNVNGSRPSLVICRGYGRAHFPKGRQTITLRLPVGKKKWHAIFHIRRDSGGYVLYGGWVDFVRGNNLREQDVCLLQPMDKGEGRRFTVIVHLLPKARSTSRKVRSGYVVLGDGTCLTLPQEKIVAERVKVIQSEAPIYVAIIDKSSYFALDLGAMGGAPADGHLPDGAQTLVLRQAGWSKAWHAEMLDRRMLPGGGWHEFAADNRLQAGDLCLLEPVKGEVLAMSVHIIRREQYY
ncbi:B3 domain-containing protein Os03g0620400 [Triticum aestivum]|uniref:B3 domain-containing protein Os03g0620400 n=1 Tax=Triticum aestivum TaxID=4565 RepID=UPI001D0298B2|nr:B3 domain-containing protein Os03g0620400-like [Triticum aestivum]